MFEAQLGTLGNCSGTCTEFGEGILVGMGSRVANGFEMVKLVIAVAAAVPIVSSSRACMNLFCATCCCSVVFRCVHGYRSRHDELILWIGLRIETRVLR